MSTCPLCKEGLGEDIDLMDHMEACRLTALQNRVRELELQVGDLQNRLAEARYLLRFSAGQLKDLATRSDTLESWGGHEMIKGIEAYLENTKPQKRAMNWGQEKAEAHMKASPTHAAVGTKDFWTCVDCDAMIPAQEVSERVFRMLKNVINDIRKTQGGQ